ncbi:MAG: DNA polymerase III subunit [Anaeromyxobacter sp.]|nr:DNA polymerase III subunit [Anaeromyxobacter sp.]MBL0276129.1 DNA polymerase III subunit [Anaeromyxobacter sp.]
MPFAEVKAQDRAVSSLRAALSRGQLHHAYLFGGPAGVGKATTARLLAQAVNCQGGPGEPGDLRVDPCGECGPCRKIARGVHPDVLELRTEREMAQAGRWEPEGGRAPSRDIVVAQVRDLTDRRLSLRLFEGRRRVVIIDPADALNPQAQNALLKTLEEPPDDTTLVLVSATPDELLPTVRSRCLRVAFGPLPEEVVVEALLARDRQDPEGAGPKGARGQRRKAPGKAEPAAEPAGAPLDPVAAARTAAALSGGSISRALAYGGPQVQALEQSVRAVAALRADRPLGWLAFARSLGRTDADGAELDDGTDRAKVQELGEHLLAWWRDVLAVQAGGAPLLAALAAETRLVAAALPPQEALRRRAGVERLLRALGQNAAGPLAVERMLIGWFDGR